MKQKVIALDGPSGSGKSTVAKVVAKNLNVLYIDTGAMYRAIGLAFEKNQREFIEYDDNTNFLQQLNFAYGVSDKILVSLDDEDISETIREHRVSALASSVSKLPSVRHFLVDYQRKLAAQRLCLMEGRDIGTVVFPDAFCKIYVYASLDVRAKRRLNQLLEKGESGHTLETVKQDVKYRDDQDASRAMSPLKKAQDAHDLDTSDLGFDQVVAKVCALARLDAKSAGFEL